MAVLVAMCVFYTTVTAAPARIKHRHESYRINVWVVRPQLKNDSALFESAASQSLPIFTEPRGTIVLSNAAVLRALNACNKYYRFLTIQERYTKIVPEGKTWIVPLKHSLFRIRPVNASHDAILALVSRGSSRSVRQQDAWFFRKWLAIYTTSILNDPSKGGNFPPQKSYGARFVVPESVNFVDLDTEAISDPNPAHFGHKELSEALLFSVTPQQP